MNLLLKAVIIGGLITAAIFAIVVFIIPIMAFLIIASIISGLTYVVIKEEREATQHQDLRPPS